jgi:hypothetical protein
MLALGAGAAFSETIVTARIPFAFEVRGTALPPGDYAIQRGLSSSTGVLLIRNLNGKGAAFVMAKNHVDAGDVNPKLTFRCTGDDCYLAGMSLQSERWEFGTPRLTPAQKERLAAIYLHQTKVH